MLKRERWPWVITVALFAAGLLLRLWGAMYGRFLGDEAHQWATAVHIARFEEFPSFGPSVSGSAANVPGPLFYYLMAIPELLSSHPYLCGAFTSLLHLLCIAGLYRLAKEARGTTAALFLLAMLVANPWEVFYGDRVWSACMMPVWAMGTAYASCRVTNPKWQAALLVLLFSAPQIHLSAPVLWVLSAILLLLGPRFKLSWKWIGIGVLATALLWTPPLIQELRTDFANTRAILSEGGGHEPAEKTRQIPWRTALYTVLFSTSEIGYQFGEGYFGWKPFDDAAEYGTNAGLARRIERAGPLRAALQILSVVVAALCWIAFAIVWARTRWKGRVAPLEVRLTLAVVGSMVVAAALLMFAHKPFFPHYLLYVGPLAVWPVAMMLDRAYAQFGRVGGGAVIATTCAVVIGMAINVVHYYREIDGCNGVMATVSMVAAVQKGPQPYSVRFEGMNNQFVWNQVSSVRPNEDTVRREPRPTRYLVHNAETQSAAISPQGTLHYGVELERQ